MLQALAQDEVHLEGHLLVCGCGTPTAALACLLKPLRSTALPGQRPIVVLDTTTPEGPGWEELSRWVRLLPGPERNGCTSWTLFFMSELA